MKQTFSVAAGTYNNSQEHLDPKRRIETFLIGSSRITYVSVYKDTLPYKECNQKLNSNFKN